MEGWIKLHRKFLEWEWYNDINTKVLFIHILLKVNHKNKKWKGKVIKKGQFITGLYKLSEETGLSIQSIRTSLKRLESTGEINKQSNKQYTVITVCKYDKYQLKENKSTNNLTNEQQTANKQLTTTKNDKNVNNIYREFAHLKITKSEIKKVQEKGYTISQIDNILDQIENYSENKRYVSLYLTLNNWIKKEKPINQPKGVY